MDSATNFGKPRTEDDSGRDSGTTVDGRPYLSGDLREVGQEMTRTGSVSSTKVDSCESLWWEVGSPLGVSVVGTLQTHLRGSGLRPWCGFPATDPSVLHPGDPVAPFRGPSVPPLVGPGRASTEGSGQGLFRSRVGTSPCDMALNLGGPLSPRSTETMVATKEALVSTENHSRRLHGEARDVVRSKSTRTKLINYTPGTPAGHRTTRESLVAVAVEG